MSVFEGLDDIFAEALGGPLVYVAGGDDPKTIVGIFNRRYLSLAAGIGAPVESGDAACHVRAKDVPQVARGDTIDVDDYRYRVVEIAPDGKGMTTLVLEKLEARPALGLYSKDDAPLVDRTGAFLTHKAA